MATIVFFYATIYALYEFEALNICLLDRNYRFVDLHNQTGSVDRHIVAALIVTLAAQKNKIKPQFDVGCPLFFL